MEEMNNYQYGTREKIIDKIMELELEVRFIPMHRETREKLETYSDEYLARYSWELQELKTRGGGSIANS